MCCTAKGCKAPRGLFVFVQWISRNQGASCLDHGSDAGGGSAATGSCHDRRSRQRLTSKWAERRPGSAGPGTAHDRAQAKSRRSRTRSTAGSRSADQSASYRRTLFQACRSFTRESSRQVDSMSTFKPKSPDQRTESCKPIVEPGPSAPKDPAVPTPPWASDLTTRQVAQKLHDVSASFHVMACNDGM